MPSDLPVTVAVFQPVKRASGCDKDRAIAGDSHVHRLLRPLEKRAGAFGLAVAVAILEDANSIRRRPLITGRPEVRVALDDQDATALVDRDSCGRDDLWLGGDQLEHQSRIKRPGGRSRRRTHGPNHRQRNHDPQTQSDSLHHQRFSNKPPCGDRTADILGLG